jgi:hypothetical protein
MVFREEILPSIGWPVITVLLTPAGASVQDTSDMVDLLEARHPALPLVSQTGCGASPRCCSNSMRTSKSWIPP